TAVTGARRPSWSRTAGAPMSPACTMWATPARAASASGRSSPWVSEMTPTAIGLRARRGERAPGVLEVVVALRGREPTPARALQLGPQREDVPEPLEVEPGVGGEAIGGIGRLRVAGGGDGGVEPELLGEQRDGRIAVDGGQRPAKALDVRPDV